MKNTCCVPHCESRRCDVKLHRFPTVLPVSRIKWLQAINSPKLEELRSEQLKRYFVCHLHFEKRFVTNKLRLHRTAYPTLISSKEIARGKPTITYQDIEKETKERRHEDHSYVLRQPLVELQLTQCDAGPSSPSSRIDKTVTEDSLALKEFLVFSSTSTDKRQSVEDSSIMDAVPSSPGSVIDNSVVDNTPVVRNVTTAQKKRVNKKAISTPSDYAKLSKLLSRTRKQLNIYRKTKTSWKQNAFEKLTKNMHPIAKKLMLMQVQQQSKKSAKGRRFSEEDKLLALSIFKASPVCYNFLHKIFTLPSTRTLNKMLRRARNEAGTNSQRQEDGNQTEESCEEIEDVSIWEQERAFKTINVRCPNGVLGYL